MSLENVTGDIESHRFNAQHSSTLSFPKVTRSLGVHAKTDHISSHTANGGTELAVLLLPES